MENREIGLSEDWIKIVRNDIPEGEFIVTSFVQDINKDST